MTLLDKKTAIEKTNSGKYSVNLSPLNFIFPVIWLLLSCDMAIGQVNYPVNVMPPPVEQSIDEPVRYTGDTETDKRYYDGHLPHAIGSHHIQTFRANRKYPVEPGSVGWTYNHQPYLAYWNNRFYLQYLSGLVQEHEPPSRLMLQTSADGRSWSDPVVLFPEYPLPDIEFDGEKIAAGTKAVMHQRMGFYVAPNGRLLASGFYGYSATPRRSPNAGNGIGRVVREIYEDGSFGPVYFIRHNRHAGWDASNTSLPFYTESTDTAFIDACEALLADKLVTLQWWEEDRGDDGFYATDPSAVQDGEYFSAKITTSAGAGKAFTYYNRPDGVTVGLWKNQYSALSTDRGESWSPITRSSTLWTSGAKTWGQRTGDGRFVIVHNQSATKRNRFPMAVLVGDDGHSFDRLYNLSGEVPPRRYKGLWKNPGLQYFRGIFPGNGTPPGDYLWMTYSVNKEDIWFSKTRIPVTGVAAAEISEDFQGLTRTDDLVSWNIYQPLWTSFNLVDNKDTGRRYLQITDEEPYDYAVLTGFFPKSAKKTIEFDVQAERIPIGHSVEIEVQDQAGNRALKLAFDRQWIAYDIETVRSEPIDIMPGEWYSVRLEIDCERDMYSISVKSVNNELNRNNIPLNGRMPTDTVERLMIRTGPYRNQVRSEYVEHGLAAQANFLSDDLPGSEQKSPKVIFNIDNIKTK
ncbi:MAG: hypothetical protein ACNA8K_15310 [Cyclonatronaceae bacterium]